jgi:hypothetical protein
MTDHAAPSGAEVTLFTNANEQPLSKSYALVNGAIEKTPAANMFAGTAERRVLRPGREMRDFLLIIEAMRASEAIALGRVKGGTGEHGETFRVTTADRLAAAQAGTIARSRSNFTFPRKAGIALVDVDLKGAPPEVQIALERASIRDLLIGLYPPMADVASVSRGSLSSAVHVEGTQPLSAGAAGVHLFVLLNDVSRTAEFLKALHRLFWGADLGWIMVGKSGALHVRSVVDVSVGHPERLVFEGDPASVGPGLVLDPEARKPTLHEGAELDVERFLAHVNEVAPQASHDARVKAAKQALREEAAAVRAAYEVDQEGALVSRGATRQAARRTVRLRREGCLTSDDIMFDESGQRIGVVEVLLALGARDGRAVPDPVEGPGYGMTTAQVVAEGRDDGLPGVFTYAHGGGWYRLRWSASGIGMLMERRGEALTADELIEAFRASADVRVDDVGRILQGAGVLLDSKHPSYFRGGMPLLAKTCKRALPAAFPDEPDDEQDGVAGEPERVEVKLLGPDEPSDVRRINAALAKKPPVVFSRPGALVRIGYDRPAGDQAARTPRMVTLNDDGRCRLALGGLAFKRAGSGGLVPCSPSRDLLATWRSEQEAHPYLAGITSFPPIGADGEVRNIEGFDAGTGLYYDGSLGESFANLIPDAPTRDDALRSLQYLRKEVLRDFAYENREKGLAAHLALILTAVTRLDYATAPIFLVTARKAGTGKGLAINVAGVIAQGFAPPANSLPLERRTINEDELRKTLLGMVQGGRTLVHFDDTTVDINSPSLNSLATTGRLSGRILNSTNDPTFDARLLVCFSGNNITATGDTVRRVVLLDMQSDEERPEQRSGFRHPDLLKWILDNRPAVAAAIITILRAYRLAGRPQSGARVLGSFGRWSEEIGGCVAWLTGVDPTSTQDDLRSGDTETARLRAVLRCWREVLGGASVTCRQVVGKSGEFDAEELATVPGDPARLRRLLEEHEIVSSGGETAPKQLAAFVSKHRGNTVAGLRFMSTEHRDGTKRWAVEAIGEPNGADDAI